MAQMNVRSCCYKQLKISDCVSRGHWGTGAGVPCRPRFGSVRPFSQSVPRTMAPFLCDQEFLSFLAAAEKQRSFTAGEAFLSLSQAQTIRIRLQREYSLGPT